MKMEGAIGKARDGSAMQRFSHGGVALLPFTKHILLALWENVRLMLQVICCTVMAVFQMFRFEVHLRITEETGEHIQHMTNGHADSEGFLLSSLFETNKNVGVQGPLSRFNKEPFNPKSHHSSVLSSLVNDELCCSLVDDLVSCASDCLNEGVCAGEQVAWKHRFDWNFYTGLKTRVDKECASSYGKGVQEQSDCCTGSDCNLSRSKLISQSSDSEFSWGSSDSSSLDRDQEESDVLWDLLSCSNDPYHPLHFTACMSSANRQRTQTGSRPNENGFTLTQCSVSHCSDSSERGIKETVNAQDEEEALWKSLCWDDDPYHPLNFRAPLYSASAFADSRNKKPATSRAPSRGKSPKTFTQRQVVSHRCPRVCVEKPTKVPWRKPVHKTVHTSKTTKIPLLKRVEFSPVVQIHKMRAWSFALQACRKGPWEEYARDRGRFHKRIWETEQAIGYCFMQSHRDKFLNYQQSTVHK